VEGSSQRLVLREDLLLQPHYVLDDVASSLVRRVQLEYRCRCRRSHSSASPGVVAEKGRTRKRLQFEPCFYLILTYSTGMMGMKLGKIVKIHLQMRGFLFTHLYFFQSTTYNFLFFLLIFTCLIDYHMWQSYVIETIHVDINSLSPW
jgi:hypothetical protein